MILSDIETTVTARFDNNPTVSTSQKDANDNNPIVSISDFYL